MTILTSGQKPPLPLQCMANHPDKIGVSAVSRSWGRADLCIANRRYEIEPTLRADSNPCIDALVQSLIDHWIGGLCSEEYHQHSIVCPGVEHPGNAEYVQLARFARCLDRIAILLV